MNLSPGLKQFLLSTLPKSAIFAFKRTQLKGREAQEYETWDRSNRTIPAPHRYKQEILREYARRYQVKTLVETGTFLGLMIEAQLGHFEKLISIELDEPLYRAAVKRFRKQPQVRIVQGDSGEKIREVVPGLKEPALFWLDGHYSGGFTALGSSKCPIYGELESILASPLHHVILIDDARCFDGTQDYPTIEELRNFIDARKHGLQVQVENDVIRITPNA